MTYAPYRDRFTASRNKARANGEPVAVGMDITALVRFVPGISCRLCAAPAVLGIEVWQVCPGSDSTHDLDNACEHLCTQCAEQHAPGLLDATRRWDAVRNVYWSAFRAARGAPLVAHLTKAARVIADVRTAAAEALWLLGFDYETSTEALDGLITTVIVSDNPAGVCVAGPDVPGGELHFMPDTANPDGPLGNVAAH